MSSLMATASRLKPDIRLAQAVSQFEADLSSEHKAIFQDSRSQARSSPPAHLDVLRLTAEVDRRASGKVGGGRCFGPRFINLLEAVQRFAALGDVIVGGSQNIIACGVWSLVRMTLLFAVSSASYLEGLSLLFMNAGRSAPRFQVMALLYPQSRALQSSMSEYFIVVVSLCHQLLKFTQKSVIGQLIASLSDSDTKKYQSELEFRATSIRAEVNLLIGQKVEEESLANTRFRAFSLKSLELISAQRLLKAKLRILDACSTYDYETTWKQIRKEGNTTLFNEAAQYGVWNHQSTSSTLIYTGRLGSGKSVLLANIVEHLNLSVNDENTAVAYFFCQHDISQSLEARTILGSLARQILRLIPNLSSAANLLFDETSLVMDLENLLKLVHQLMPPELKVYFVLDGVDECSSAVKEILVRELRGLQGTFALLLCLSTRLEINNMLEIGNFRDTRIWHTPENNLDIEAFIGRELAYCLESGKLAIGNPAIILDIQDALLEGSQGMFLWVALQIKSLCLEKTDEAIREALANLPKDLSGTFTRILQGTESSGNGYQKRILQLLTVAKRPLTTEELREAIGVVIGDPTWNSATLVNDIYSTLSCCGALVMVDEEELTVRVVHHSVTQFLLSGCEDRGPEDTLDVPFSLENAQTYMAEIIVTYLNYGVFGTQLSSTRVPQLMTASVPSNVIASALHSSPTARNIALNLLRSKKKANRDIGSTVAAASKYFKSRSTEEFCFYQYAKSHWYHHTRQLSRQNTVINNLLMQLFTLNLIEISAMDEDWKSSLLWWAVRNGETAIVQLLIDHGNMKNILEDIDRVRSLMSVASRYEHLAVVDVLLSLNKFPGSTRVSRARNQRTPLSWAVINGHVAIIKLLLQSPHYSEVNWLNGDDETPLHLAAKRRSTAVVKILLGCNGVDPNLSDRLGRTPLLLAAIHGQKDITKLLLDTSGVEPNCQDEGNCTPLFWAVKNNHISVAQLLLEYDKTDANLPDMSGQTPLFQALMNSHTSITTLLLNSSKVDFNFQDRCGYTPLYWALVCSSKYFDLILGHKNVDANIKDHEGLTPLSYAVKIRRMDAVSSLLKSGKVNATIKTNSGRTPLQIAIDLRHKKITKMLEDHLALNHPE